MIKKFFFLALICVLFGCQKDTVQLDSKVTVQNNSKDMVQLDSNESVSSSRLSDFLNYNNLPSEVKDILANGVDDHTNSCSINNNRELVNVFGVGSASLGAYAYPYTLNMGSKKLFRSSLPCQPGIPYFLFSYLEVEGNVAAPEYSATFHLVLNPSFYNTVKVVDVNWESNGLNDLTSVHSFTVNDLQIGESHSISCQVFSTDDNVSVYSQEMVFDFETLLNIGGDDPVVIEFGSGYTYACTNNGFTPIIVP